MQTILIVAGLWLAMYLLGAAYWLGRIDGAAKVKAKIRSHRITWAAAWPFLVLYQLVFPTAFLELMRGD